MLGQPNFLNLPIWANFVDPTDLSLYYYLLIPTTRANQFYRMDSTSSSTSTRLDKQSGLSTEYLVGLVEVEAG